MFSRILASEIAVVPATQAGLKREASSSDAAEHGEPPVHLDHRRRCSGGRGRRGRRRPRRGSRRTRAPSSSICSSLRLRERALDLVGQSVMACSSCSEVDLDAPLGRVDAGADHLALGPVTSPLRRSRTWPEQSLPTQVWQIPSRQPNGSSSPASSPATRIGVAPSHSASVSLLAKHDRAALALLGRRRASAGSAPCAGGRSRPRRSQCSVERVEQLAGPGEERLALAPVGAELVEVAGRHPRPSRR